MTDLAMNIEGVIEVLGIAHLILSGELKAPSGETTETWHAHGVSLIAAALDELGHNDTAPVEDDDDPRPLPF